MELTESAGKFRPDWGVIHSYIEKLEATGQQPELTARYRDTVRRYLELQQLEVEKGALRSSSVLHDSPLFDQFMHGLFPVLTPVKP